MDADLKVKLIPSWWRASEGSLVPLVAAMSLGFTSPALETMKGWVLVGGHCTKVPDELAIFAQTDAKCGDGNAAADWFSSLVNFGALLGALFSGWLCSRVGQRNVLLLSLVFIAICWAWSAFAVAPWQLILARIPIGLGVGLQSVAAPSLLKEFAPPSLRGTYGTAISAAIVLGVLLVDFIGGSVMRSGANGEFCEWRRLALLVSLSALMVAGAALPLLRQSPLAPLPGTPAPTRALPRREGGESRHNVEALTRWRLLLAGFVPMVLQQLGGINAIMFFCQGILEDAHVKSYNLSGLMVILMQLMGILVAAVLVERLGRRPLLLLSSTGMALSAAVLSIMLQGRRPPVDGVVGCLCTFSFVFALGLGPVPWLLIPELTGLPKQDRIRLASFATACNWACSFVVTGAPLTAVKVRWGLSGVFALFSGICLAGAVLMALLVPETAVRRATGRQMARLVTPEADDHR